MTAHPTRPQPSDQPPPLTFPPDPLRRPGPPCCKRCGGSLLNARTTQCPFCRQPFLPHWPCTYTRPAPPPR